MTEEKRPSLMIATPMYGGMCTGHYVQGLLMTMNKMREIGVNVAWCQIMNESLITRARNELARVFLASDHDYLMFIDADIGFDGEAVAQLMLADKDTVCCIEVRHGGTGFMLIKRGVFEELIPHVPTYRVSSFKDPETGEYAKPLTHEFFATSIDATGALLSEDYHFCELWRTHGGKIHAHPFIKLHHVGTYVFGGDILQSGGNLK